MTSASQHVAVLGASPKPQRYAYQAIQLLLDYEHQVYPIHPKINNILGINCYANLTDLQTSLDHPIDTLTLYVGTARLGVLIDAILKLAPRRIIFNPGT